MLTRSWHGIGTLEMRINRYKKYTDRLIKGNIVFPFNELHKAYIILHREIELDEQGKITENWLIRAFELKVIIEQRITLPPAHTSHDNKSGSAEEVMKHYVNNNIINPVDLKREIPQLITSTGKAKGINVNWQSRFKNLAEELVEISFLSGLGWNVAIDYKAKKWVLDIQQGRDFSVNQTIQSPVIFSPQFDNIKNMSYVESDLNHRNTAYVAGQGEGIERRVIELGNIAGLARNEIFIDARDIAEETDTDPPEKRPEQDIIRDLADRGEQRLREMLQEEYLEAEIMTPYKNTSIDIIDSFVTQFQPVKTVVKKEKVISTFMYEVDYDLGDIVTIQNKEWGVTMNARITEIKEVYEASGFKIEAVFGNNRPTLIDKMKQSLQETSAEVRR